MKRSDVPRLFDLLEQLYQGKRKPRDEVTVAIWAEVLKPWPYEQVRDAAIKRARENRFFPDPSELAEFLSPAPKEEEPDERMRPASPSEMRSLQWGIEFRKLLTAVLEEKGLPTTSEAAKEAGMSYTDWMAAREAAGVDTDRLLIAALPPR